MEEAYRAFRIPEGEGNEDHLVDELGKRDYEVIGINNNVPPFDKIPRAIKKRGVLVGQLYRWEVQVDENEEGGRDLAIFLSEFDF
jgi:hypothetical protein